MSPYGSKWSVCSAGYRRSGACRQSCFKAKRAPGRPAGASDPTGPVHGHLVRLSTSTARRSPKPCSRRIVRLRTVCLHRREAVKLGLFQMANGGVLFLDEIGLLLGPSGQASERRSTRFCAPPRRNAGTRTVDVAIVAATNENLPLAIRETRFRRDLYSRVAVLSDGLPPLPCGGNDIELLAERFPSRGLCGVRHPAKNPRRRRPGCASQARLAGEKCPRAEERHGARGPSRSTQAG